MGKRSKEELLAELRQMLNEVFQLRSEGGAYAKLARAHGYVDGYMRMLLDAGLVTKAELIELVGQERQRVAGPATAVLNVRVA